MRRTRRGGPDFTHFANLPFISEEYRKELSEVQNTIVQQFEKIGMGKCLEPNNPYLFHLTLTMLIIPHEKSQKKTRQILEAHKSQLLDCIKNTVFTTGKVKYFTRRDMKNPNTPLYVKLIYLQLENDQNFKKIEKLVDLFIRILLKDEIIVSSEFKMMNITYDHNTNLFKINQPHMTLFRCREMKEQKEVVEILKLCETMFGGKKLECRFMDVSTRFEYDETKFCQPFWRMLCKEQ